MDGRLLRMPEGHDRHGISAVGYDRRGGGTDEAPARHTTGSSLNILIRSIAVSRNFSAFGPVYICIRQSTG